MHTRHGVLPDMIQNIDKTIDQIVKDPGQAGYVIEAGRQKDM